MIKRYTFDQLENFVKGYRLAKPETEPHFGKFQASICDAMDQIYTLWFYYADKPTDFFKHYNRKNPKFHGWVSFDTDTRELIYDTRTRDEEWSNELLDNLFDKYEYYRVKQFADEKKSKELPVTVSTVESEVEVPAISSTAGLKSKQSLKSN